MRAPQGGGEREGGCRCPCSLNINLELHKTLAAGGKRIYTRKVNSLVNF